MTSDGIGGFNAVAGECFNRAGTCPTGVLAITLDGQVEAKPLSNAVNVVKGLITAIAAANGRAVGDGSPEKVMMSLQLAAKLDGFNNLGCPLS